MLWSRIMFYRMPMVVLCVMVWLDVVVSWEERRCRRRHKSSTDDIQTKDTGLLFRVRNRSLPRASSPQEKTEEHSGTQTVLLVVTLLKKVLPEHYQKYAVVVEE